MCSVPNPNEILTLDLDPEVLAASRRRRRHRRHPGQFQPGYDPRRTAPFQPGYDARRHSLSRAERRRGGRTAYAWLRQHCPAVLGWLKAQIRERVHREVMAWANATFVQQHARQQQRHATMKG